MPTPPAPPAEPVPLFRWVRLSPNELSERFALGLERWTGARDRLAVDGGDVEAIHDIRVASRRLGEVLALLPTAARPAGLRRRVRRAVREFGARREADVTAAWIAKGGEGIEGVESILARFEADRLAARGERAVARLLEDGEEIAAGLARALARLQSLARNRPPLVAAELRENALARVRRRLAPFLESLPESPSFEELHALRVAAKKLRYLAETLGGASAADLGRRARALQQASGDWHDVAVATNRLAEVEAEAAERGDAIGATAAASIRPRLLAKRIRLYGESLERAGRLRLLVVRLGSPPKRSTLRSSPSW
jgi:CHAD domain-containing protein